ncbi:MAG TPA: phage baseplate assembly protein V [Pyrinomonadaceae bacterium]|nr:phage baseplate assembly protein V [Pyrinomonadaceae bacterium]
MSSGIAAARPDGSAQRYFGVFPAIVTDIVDSDNLGRIQVKLPWLGADGDSVRAWATLLTPYADDDQGFEFLPAVDTQVVIAFEAGDLRRPYILGSAWNGSEALPEAPAAANNKRLIKTRAGSLLEFDDSDGAAKVTLSMKSGHKVILDDSAQEVTVEHSNGCLIKLTVAGQVQIQANATVEITASAVNVHAATATFDGIVNCTTLIASSGVVSPSYTPGAGNIW